MAGHEIHHATHASEILEATGPFLVSDPVRHNVVLTVLQERAHHPEPGHYWWVTQDDRVVGVALQSPAGHPASITPMDPDALEVTVPAVASTLPTLPGVIGEAGPAARFAGRWSELTGAGAIPDEGQRLYRLGRLRAPKDVRGRLRSAGPDELATIMDFWHGLAADTGLPAPGEGGAGLISRRIAQGEIWIWDVDGLVASMARLSAPAAGTVRVGFVYTPAEHRRNGYAAASVAALSAHARSQGAAECVLYTQLSNRTSNGIYRTIGYEAVAEVLSYRFTERTLGPSEIVATRQRASSSTTAGSMVPGWRMTAQER